MADEQPQSPTRNRRSSFAGQTFADLFGNGRPSVSGRGQSESNSPPPQQQSLPGPISQAAAQAQQRRMSLTTLGLSGSPNQTSPFGSYRGRRGSISASTDESAIAEDDSPTQKEESGTSPSPFARRTSFGAKALRDRMGSFGGAGNTGQNGTRSPPASNKAQNGTISSKGRGLSFALPLAVNIPQAPFDSRRLLSLTSLSAPGPSGEGFNWSDNFRTRAERTSIAGPGAMPAQSGHGRAKSVAVMEPPPAAAMPAPKEQKRPDHFQERILKGDFYMD